MLMSAELKRSVTWFIYFLNLLWVRYNCVKGSLFTRPLPHSPIVNSPERVSPEPILNRVKVWKSSYNDLINRKRGVTCDRSTLFCWSSCYKSLKRFLQLYDVISNYVIGQKLKRGMVGLQWECTGAHIQYKVGCREDVCLGLKSKHVRIQTYFSMSGVYLGEGEDPPPLLQNCKNISPWFPAMLILKCT